MTEATEKTIILAYHHAFNATDLVVINCPKDKLTRYVINEFFEEIIDEEFCEGDHYEIYLDDIYEVLHELPLKFTRPVPKEENFYTLYEGTKGEEND